MRTYHSTLVGAALMVMAAATPAIPQSGPGVFGFYDVASGTFRPVTLQAMPSPNAGGVEPQAVTSRSGRIRFKITINVKNNTDPLILPGCSGSFSHQGVLRSYSEQVSITGTRTGNTGECVIVIFYSWPEANDANPVNLSISASIGSPSRFHSQSLPPIPLPADGATTVINVSITL